jgi:hypothetical protein
MPATELDSARVEKRPRGRPKKATPAKIAEIGELRRLGVPWVQVGLRLGLNPETCRRALWAVRKARRAVENPPARASDGSREA